MLLTKHIDELTRPHQAVDEATIVSSISNTLCFEVAPCNNFTFDGATPKCFASNFTAAKFARPSMAGALV